MSVNFSNVPGGMPKAKVFISYSRREEAGRPRGLLLRSPVLEEAERWVASRPQDAPLPTHAAQAFIAESRGAATRRQRVMIGASTAAALVAIGLASVALWQRQRAVTNEKLAVQYEHEAVAAKNDAEVQRNAAVTQRDKTLATARIWDAASGRILAVLKGHSKFVDAAEFAPDGVNAVTASSDNTSRLWETATGKSIAILRGHIFPVKTAQFSPDGKQLVTASDDDTARVWNVESAKTIAILSGHDGFVKSASLSPAGDVILTWSVDHTARLWRVYPDTQGLVDFAKASVKEWLVQADFARRLRLTEPPLPSEEQQERN